MKHSIALAVVVLVVAAGFARAGGGEKAVEERLAAIEARLDRIEARLAPEPSAPAATLTATERAALVAAARALRAFTNGQNKVGDREVLARLAPEHLVALEDIEKGLNDGKRFGVTLVSLRDSISMVAGDMYSRWLNGKAMENEALMRAAIGFRIALEQADFAGLKTAYEAWHKERFGK